VGNQVIQLFGGHAVALFDSLSPRFLAVLTTKRLAVVPVHDGHTRLGALSIDPRLICIGCAVDVPSPPRVVTFQIPHSAFAAAALVPASSISVHLDVHQFNVIISFRQASPPIHLRSSSPPAVFKLAFEP